MLEKSTEKGSVDVFAKDFRMNNDFFPIKRCFVMDCARNLGISVVQSCCGIMPLLLAIGYYLDCPIAAMSGDYLIASRPSIVPDELKMKTIHDPKVVEISQKDFYIIEKKEGKSSIRLKVYHSENSPLKSVPAVSRPLISLLMNRNLISKVPSPIKIQQLGSESYTSAKLRAVIDYVTKTNPIHVLQSIMESFDGSKSKEHASASILLFLERFCPDFVEASQILSLLNMERGIPLVRARPRSLKDDKQGTLSSPLVFFNKAAERLKGVAFNDRQPDFLYRWPCALAKLYRFSMLDKLFVTPLYSESGVFMRFANEYLIDYPCVFGPSRLLRFAHYCLIVGVEEKNELKSKLVGLRPHVREICYEGHFHYKTYNIHVKPLHLPPRCSVDDFIYAFLGFNCTSDIPDWSIALVVSCLLWHQNKEEHKDCDISECPLILSALMLATVTYYASQGDLLALSDHYNALKAQVHSKIEEEGAGLTSQSEKELMHGSLELMWVYDHYISLTRLLAALQEDNRTPDFASPIYNRFPQIYLMFPSFSLLVLIASHLKLQAKPSNVVLRLWMMRAFFSTLTGASRISRLQDTVKTFTTLTEFIATTKLRFDSPEVNITDPPSFFLPKEERIGKRSPPERKNGLNGKPNKPFVSQNVPRRSFQKKGASYADQLARRMGNVKLNSPGKIS